MQLQLKKVLNRVHLRKGFVYADVRLHEGRRGPYIEVTIKERRGSQGTCSGCGAKGACYDHLPQRRARSSSLSIPKRDWSIERATLQ